MMFVPHWKHMPPLPVTGDSFIFLYVDYVHTSQETQDSIDCYGDSFTFLTLCRGNFAPNLEVGFSCALLLRGVTVRAGANDELGAVEKIDC
jgi:hypothetical protein